MEFQEPPPERRRQRSPHWENVVAELRANPMQWAKAGNYSPGVSTHIRQGKYPSFVPAGTEDAADYMRDHWEVTTRKTDSGKRIDIYIRWIGDGPQA